MAGIALTERRGAASVPIAADVARFWISGLDVAGIALTERRGAASVPIAADVARFWISRLHGPEANDWAVLRSLGIAAQKLNEGDEASAQQALEARGLTRLSSDGAVLMRAVAGSLGIGPLDLPWADGPRLWRAEDIAAHLPLFKGLRANCGTAREGGGLGRIETSALALRRTVPGWRR